MQLQPRNHLPYSATDSALCRSEPQAGILITACYSASPSLEHIAQEREDALASMYAQREAAEVAAAAAADDKAA